MAVAAAALMAPPYEVYRNGISRRFKKLRLSITDECNLRCAYCDRTRFTPEKHHFPFEQMVHIINQLQRILDLDSVRITGGEPLLNPFLPEIIAECRNAGIPEVSMTTNGIGLGEALPALIKAGLSRINVSMDAIDPKIFIKMTGSDNVHEVLSSLEICKEAGIPVKVNCVIMKGLNENQVLPILEFGMEKNIEIRFLELMKMGNIFDRHEEYFYPSSAMVEQISRLYTVKLEGRGQNATASSYLAGTYRFGIIANHSESFCDDCDRLRLDSRGNLFGCLSSTNSYSLNKMTEEEIRRILGLAMDDKMKTTFRGSSVNMRQIGG